MPKKPNPRSKPRATMPKVSIKRPLESALKASLFTPSQGNTPLLEPHPAAPDALQFIRNLPISQIALIRETLEYVSRNNPEHKLSAVCLDTLNRILNAQPVGDRFVLGLAFMIYKYNLTEEVS